MHSLWPKKIGIRVNGVGELVSVTGCRASAAPIRMPSHRGLVDVDAIAGRGRLAALRLLLSNRTS